jgi:hypothetical protein
MKSEDNVSVKSLIEELPSPQLDEPIDDANDGKQPLLEQQESAFDEKSIDLPANNSSLKIIVLSIVAVCILAILGVVIYFVCNGQFGNTQMIEALIAQPFTENNQFMHFILGNGLKVLLVQPGTGMTNSFICKLSSPYCRRRVRERPKRLHRLHPPH